MKRLFSGLRKPKVFASMIAVMLILSTVMSLAYFTDRVSHEMTFTTASFTKDGYTLTRIAPNGPFIAGEAVVTTIQETNGKDIDVSSTITMTAEWTCIDPDIQIFSNAAPADNATLTVSGAGITGTVNIDYTVVSGDKITFDIPAHVLAAGASDQELTLTLNIPDSLVSTGEINFTFENVALSQTPSGFATSFDPDASLDYGVRVGWASSSYSEHNGKALMGYLVKGEDTVMELPLYATWPGEAGDSFPTLEEPYYSWLPTTAPFVNKEYYFEAGTPINKNIIALGDPVQSDYEHAQIVVYYEGYEDVGGPDAGHEQWATLESYWSYEDLDVILDTYFPYGVASTNTTISVYFDGTDPSAGGLFLHPGTDTPYNIEYEFAFGYTESPMKDFTSRTDARWSYYSDRVGELIFPEGVTTIGDYAFCDFYQVLSLDLPETLTAVGAYAFDNTSLFSLTIPANVKTFEEMCFGHINELTEITFNASELTDITFPQAGSTTGAFYVDPYVPTKILGANGDAQNYDWVSDQRRVAPVIRPYEYTFDRNIGLQGGYVAPEVDFHTAALLPTIKNVVFADANAYYHPDNFKAICAMKADQVDTYTSGNITYWNVTDPEASAANRNAAYSVIAALDSTTGKLTIMCDGGKTIANKNSAFLFALTTGLETIDARKYDTSNAETFYCWHFFNDPDAPGSEPDVQIPSYGATTILGADTWDTGNVVQFSRMFHNAENLKNIDVSNWNTSNAMYLDGLFKGCSNLTSDVIDVSKWNVEKVTTIDAMFARASGFTGSIGLENWYMPALTTMEMTFSSTNFESLNLNKWMPEKLENMYQTFLHSGVKNLDMSQWTTPNLITLQGTFMGTKNLTSLDLSKWNTSKVESMLQAFKDSGIQSLNATNWDFTSCGITEAMFANASSLKNITGEETWTNMGEIFRFEYMFDGCESLETLSVEDWDVSGAYYSFGYKAMFRNCKSLTSIDVSNWTVTNVRVFDAMFQNCEKLPSIDITNWDIYYLANMDDMFNGCRSFTELTFPASVNFIEARMAANCPKLEKIIFLSTSAELHHIVASGEEDGAFYVAPADALARYPDTGKIPTEVVVNGEGMKKLLDGRYSFDNDNRVLPKVLVSIAVTTPPDTTVYANGSDFDKTGMKVTAYYDDGSSRVLGDDEYTILDGTDLPMGQDKITVSYTEGAVTATATTPITVKKMLTSIAVTTPPDKTTYSEGSDFDKTGMKVTAYYSDGTSRVLGDDEYTILDGTELPLEQTEITVCYVEEGITRVTTTPIKVWMPGLYQETAVNLFLTEGPDAIADMLITPWDELLANEIIYNTNGTVSANLNILDEYLNGELLMPTDGSVTALADKAFYERDDLIAIYIPDSVTSIGDQVFRSCGQLKKVYMSSAFTKIGNYAFQGCANLTSVGPLGSGASIELSDSVTYIGYHAFANSGIKSVTLPDSVTTLDNYAFAYTKISSIGPAGSGADFEISNNITSIGSYAFFQCTKLTSVELPSSITAIKDSTFSYCSNLKSVTIPASVTSIGITAFGNCTNLQTVTFGANSQLTSIGQQAFYNCTKLTSIELPSGVKKLDGTFYNCSSLTSITIPAGVADINSSAFFGCSSLVSIDVDSSNKTYCSLNGVLYSKNMKTLVRYPIGNTATTFTIPSGVTTIESNAFEGA